MIAAHEQAVIRALFHQSRAGDEAHPPTPAEAVPEIARRRALVIDDERELAELLAEMLTREGFAVDVAFDGEQALAELRRRSYDIILSDVRMPDLDGPALLRVSCEPNGLR